MPTTSTARDDRTARIGAELLVAAKREFEAHGFHGATLERIAAAAGYTKGVVYSRFDSKADLFLALLEQRIDARAAENERLAAEAAGVEGLTRLSRHWSEVQRDDQPWTLLVLEFRVHAARHPELAARYAALHERTLAGIAAVLDRVLGDDGGGDERARLLAQLLHSIGNGATLEQAIDPAAFPPAVVVGVTRAIVESTAR